ncbi:MAG: hypothetical protein C0418_01015 [Coriobacteriaceae bacterium]|nr:hypothetical protein [Coriobacteriaceae bacterium]
MPRPIRSSKDREGKAVCVECGFRGADDNYYLLLRRLPPLYAKDPVWLVRLSADTLVQRSHDGSSQTFHKAYSIQSLTEAEKQFLMGCTPGASALPFFNFSYPNVIRVLGKRFYRLEEQELGPLAERSWVFIP